MNIAQTPKRKKRWPYILLSIIALLVVLVFVGYRFVRQLTPEQIIGSSLFRTGVTKYLGEENKDVVDLIPKFLGFDEPRTYLLLFLNNTELRPGGGFIGVYGVIRVDKGQPEVVIVEGTETLDAKTPANWTPVPPAPIAEHLGLDRWYFRDSNWSPDFVESAKKGIEFYAAEGGVAADDIDVVVGVTPTVLEELMKITGPFTIEGIEFTADNVVETLEYEVEYGYADRGLSFANRKAIIKPFMFALLSHMKDNVFSNLETYTGIFESLTEEKHIVLYGLEEDLQATFEKHNWSGVVSASDGDYLLWVDANLAALKTDHAIDRNVSYSVSKREDGRYAASAKMTYIHNGTFDWRTTRYRTYARVFVPEGAEFLDAVILDENGTVVDHPDADSGRELGKEWFGAFISTEPGRTQTLSFEYLLPASVGDTIESGEYELLVQKQIGTLVPGLTVDIKFDTTIRAAAPAEMETDRGDETYRINTDLRVDRTFKVSS